MHPAVRPLLDVVTGAGYCKDVSKSRLRNFRFKVDGETADIKAIRKFHPDIASDAEALRVALHFTRDLGVGILDDYLRDVRNR